MFTAQNQNEIKRATVVVYVSVYSPGTQIVVFDPSNYVRSLSEGSGVNTPVLTVSTRGPSGRQYSIVGGNTNDAFRIGKFNGQLLVQKTLDRETQATYNLVIRAEASNLAAEAAVTITLTDVNDNNPRITFMETEPKNVAIEDFSPAGSPVIQVNMVVVKNLIEPIHGWVNTLVDTSLTHNHEKSYNYINTFGEMRNVH